MKCVVCKTGETAPGQATITLERGSSIVVLKKVPARVCSNCGEEYVDEAQTRRALAIAEELSDAGVQVEVRDYIAA